jgi:hypothetical protein
MVIFYISKNPGVNLRVFFVPKFKMVSLMRKKLFVGMFLMLLVLTGGMAQSVIKGKVIDGEMMQALADANVEIVGLGAGVLTNQSGEFEIMVEEGKHLLRISSLGYVPYEIEISASKNKQRKLGTINLQPDIFALAEVNIISSVGEDRKTPVALTSITETEIQNQLGDQPFPEIMKMTPGVYPTRLGGGSGDANVNIRGFEQENVALLLNGIPVSSVENGLIYWNNWIGLSDATRSIQVQRGLGASNVALNSVGGTINIITKTTDATKGGSLGFSITNYGNSKLTLNLSTGMLKNGVAVNFLGSRTWGPGYVDATYVDAWSYFMSVSKQFNKRHMFVFTALGAPERHGQRTLKLSQEDIDLKGLKFNKDWGSYNGEINNASENFYHKPYLTLNHYWNISEDIFLATSAYYSPGSGGGKWTETYGPWGTLNIFEYRNPSGQIDWNAIYNNNSLHNDTATLDNGEQVSGYSKNIQTNFLASHQWAGLLSQIEIEQSEHIKFTTGIHLRYFKSKLQEKVRDLLGGDFFIDDYAWAVDGPAGRDEIKTVGDVIKVDNGAINPSASLFAQMEWDYGKINAFLSGSFNNTWYKRYDNYNYVSDTESDLIVHAGFDVKAGINYNISVFHNIYANGGYFSRAPYFKYVFGSFTNVPTQGLANEKVKAFELGYAYNSGRTKAGANVYYTYWEDKNFLSNEYIQLENQTQTRALVTGLDALHLGLELDVEHQFTDYLSFGGLISVGNWKWKNDVQATLFNDNNVAVDTVEVYADGLYVGGAPQFQAGLFGTLTILKSFQLTGNWLYYDNIYASFDPAGRTNSDDNSQPFEIPSYNILDVHLTYPFSFIGKPAYFGASCLNVLNSEHIIRGEDGLQHDLESFRGFWGFGRTFNFSMKVSF